MIWLTLLSNNYRAFQRSPFFESNDLFKILVFTGLTIFTIFLLIAGIFLDKLLFQFTSGADPFDAFGLSLVYILSLDLFIRSFFHTIPGIITKSYFLLPIKKGKLINSLLIRSLGSFINTYLLLVIIPFSLKTILPYYDNWQMLFFITGILLLIILNNFLMLFIKIVSKRNFLFSLIPLILVICLFSGNIFYKIEFGKLTLGLCYSFIQGEILVYVIIFLLLVLLIIGNKSVLKKLIYSDLDTSEKARINYFSFDFLNKLKEFSGYLKLEIKLIIRNKRIRLNFFISIFWMIYAVFFLLSNEYSRNNDILIVLWLIMIFGAVSFMHGQYIFSWQSSFRAFIFVSNFNIYYYLKSIYYLFLFTIGLLNLIFFPILYKSGIDMFLYFSVCLYVAGPGNYIIFSNALYNYYPIEINKVVFGNWQGMGINQFIMIFIVLGFPILLLVIFKILFSMILFEIVLSATGLACIITNDYWLSGVSKKIYRKKYRFCIEDKT